MAKKSNVRTPPVTSREIITDEQTGIKRRASFDVRVATQGYANISGILSGFAFTVVILIVQLNGNSSNPSQLIAQNQAAIGFLIAFFGCIMSCFAFSVIAAEEMLTQRANNMALFAGLGFSTATSMLFWSLAIILKTFLTTEVAIVAYQIFPLFIIVHPAYVATAALDNIYIFNFRRPNLKEFLIILIPGYLPLLSALVLRYLGNNIDLQANNFYFTFVVWASLISALFNNLLAILFSASSKDYRPPLWISGFLIGAQSLLLGSLILSL
jgi:hypothetical protein